ncbi:mannose/fructose/sorbose PTS transporter subunit IIB [Vagococcus silagei]|uniref:PTS fructose transporter subunit IIB n=1 Tax=Vagococcus silagei TaxID=2508885 RepID=A0A4S3B752_9ENTE|nr:mannose/fructose/sorbose PTS transporter subunit IIB [Vagococcus silagei]THB62267.1 PTS fructose transporter subunit IIB [Vagococcus silagei]
MDIRLVRIDDRLIHGQVATVWTKHYQVNRILVVSDSVAHDEMRKLLLVQAAPPGVKVNVIPVQKLIDVFHDFHLFTSQAKVMLLFTNPKDVKQVVEAGVPIKEINVGGMSYQTGKKMITNAVAVDTQDCEDFKFLSQAGIKIEIRKVVADNSIDLMQVLKKEKLI